MGHMLIICVQAHDVVHVGQYEHILVRVKVPELASGVSHLDEGGVACNAKGLLEQLVILPEVVLAILIRA